MTAILLCGLLLLSPGQGSMMATAPPSETQDFLNAVDLSAWDDFFARMENTELRTRLRDPISI